MVDATVLTEIRPGVYAFGDAQQVELGTADWSDVALTVAATVVSRSGSRIVLDAGSKALGADQPVWATGGGRLPIIPTPGSRPCPSTTPRPSFPRTYLCPGGATWFG